MNQQLAFMPALLACACAAQAQSSVTVFGALDAALTHSKGSVASGTTMSNNHWGASKLGFRGIEDLGGGLKAGFWIEGAIFPDSGAGGATNTNNQPGGQGSVGGLTFGRRSTVSLFGPWGELRAGRDLQPHYLNIGLFDPFAHIGIGQAQLPTSTVAGVTTTWIRASNAVHYRTPGTLGGAFVHAAYFLGEKPKDGAATARDGNGYSLRAGYEAGAVRFGVGGMQTDFATGRVTNASIAGSYDFGAVEVMAVAMRDKVAGAPPDGRGRQLGLRVPRGAHEFRAQASRYTSTAPSAPRTTRFAVGYGYDLSKRTTLYGIVARIENAGGAARTLEGALAGPDGSATGVAIGIEHTF
ncbi:porin [Verminephrobacter eiseniae]|uniref:porin n=1 Tax=Verminephrobacter eiseniae TaxID=364317 RepID=UPI0022374209|nr:porin [Verminephrobacter eiseniae]MCW5234985.1 porin [Verminephrobacter eiseniae]